MSDFAKFRKPGQTHIDWDSLTFHQRVELNNLLESLDAYLSKNGRIWYPDTTPDTPWYPILTKSHLPLKGDTPSKEAKKWLIFHAAQARAVGTSFDS